MDNEPLKSTLTELFRRSGPAHHQAYIHTNGDDPEWPLWYAEYLQADLQSLIGVEMTRSEMVYWMVRLYKEHQAHAPHSPWPEFYADYFIRHLDRVGKLGSSPHDM